MSHPANFATGVECGRAAQGATVDAERTNSSRVLNVCMMEHLLADVVDMDIIKNFALRLLANCRLNEGG